MSTHPETFELAGHLLQSASPAETSRFHNPVGASKRIIGRTALVLGLATGLVAAEATVLNS